MITPIWVIVVAMCMVQDGKTPACSVNTGTKAFTTEQECKDYAAKNYKPIPDCIQPLTIFYEKDKTP